MGQAAERPNSRKTRLRREADATIGVNSTASMEEATGVYHAKVKCAQPKGAQDPEEKRVREHHGPSA